jgi:type VI secretion system FHA domain protein
MRLTLTLTVLRCPPAVTPETRILEGGEFTVGRGPGVDWVLTDPDQMVSRRHFTAAFRGGDWQITDESSNGTFVNHDDGPIGKGNKRTLRDHDRLRAGPYEIEVNLEEDDPRQESPSHGRADSEPYSYADHQPSGFSGTIPEDAFDDPFHESFGSLDHAPQFGTPFAHQTQPDHSSILEDAMRPPAPVGQMPPRTGGIIPAGNMLPDDWEKDLLEGIGDPTPAPPIHSSPIPEDPLPFEPLHVTRPRPTPVSAPPVFAPPIPKPAIPELQADPFAEPPFHAAPPPEPPVPVPSVPATPAVGPKDIGLLNAFMAGVGLPDARPSDPTATLQHLGEAFRSLVSGLRAVLIARASIKSEFRIEQTLIRARGNNPLKFAADDDDAISALLGVGRRTDMTPSAAVTDALRDIRLHELASMAAMQAAVRTVLDGLHPDKVRASAEQGSGMSVLPGQRKARAWDVYEGLHTRTVQALSDDFDSVFGKAFARAYEETLEDLSAKEKK